MRLLAAILLTLLATISVLAQDDPAATDYMGPEWADTVLTDAVTGDAFALSDFAGKIVYVEPMATWCSNCLAQLKRLDQAKATLEDNENIVYVALSVETSISDDDLAAYAERTGYDLTFAVLSPDMLAALTAEFGRSVANPPSTPHFIIYPDGSLSELTTGFEQVEDIVAGLTEALDTYADIFTAEDDMTADIDYMGPEWADTVLTNAVTGDEFALSDFAGKIVYVEPMATWCSNCLAQLNRLDQAKATLEDNENIVYVALSVETNISDADLAAYAERTGYDLTFAVLSPDMLAALTAEFGRSVANPPSTPHFIIYPDGSLSELTTGFEQVEEIIDGLTIAAAEFNLELTTSE